MLLVIILNLNSNSNKNSNNNKTRIIINCYYATPATCLVWRTNKPSAYRISINLGRKKNQVHAAYASTCWIEMHPPSTVLLRLLRLSTRPTLLSVYLNSYVVLLIDCACHICMMMYNGNGNAGVRVALKS